VRRFLVAIDQGTTSSRAIVFDDARRIVASAQLEHQQIFPRPGWVEHDPLEIWSNVESCLVTSVQSAGILPSQVAVVGIANQRETAVAWNRTTGEPVCNAITWQDTRTQSIVDDLESVAGGDIRRITGLAPAAYFSGSKFRWILENVRGAAELADSGELAFGTIESWLLFKLTGQEVHATDVTNASRTMLMDLETLEWSSSMLDRLKIPIGTLPSIASSSEIYGYISFPAAFRGVPVGGMLGDQQAALVGQSCFDVGSAKNTYGTGNFLLMNTGTSPVRSAHGLLTTVAYQFGAEPAVYALEGSIAVTGSLVQWLRDNLGLIGSAAEIESLAASVPDNGGAYVVPAFSGLFAPHWRSDARGVIVGLTRFITRAHLARAALESAAFQTSDVVAAMSRDLGSPLLELRVDGGMTTNELLMQFQADLLGIPVFRPAMVETTALGAATAAGLAIGLWCGTDEVPSAGGFREWRPNGLVDERHRLLRSWSRAVSKSLDWVTDDEK
jgi:glycerol kinase